MTPAQRRQLIRRERFCCSTPGCQNHIWLEAHHIVAYAVGGLTVPGNLLMLCSACHKLVHQGKLKISGTAPDDLTFTDSQGRDLTRDLEEDGKSFLDLWLEFSLRQWIAEFTGEEAIIPLLSERAPGIPLSYAVTRVEEFEEAD